jgi:hypothetical protein
MSAPRQFLVPKALCASGLGASSTLDDMEFIAFQQGPAADWARKVLARENGRLLNELLGSSTRLPRGVLASMVDTGGAEVVTALVDPEGQVWTPATGWAVPDEPVDQEDTVELDDYDVAYVMRALREGSDGVAMRAGAPLAFVSAAATPADDAAVGDTGTEQLPAGSQVVAIVDSLDKDAVLEMLAVAPGPKAFRRHDGTWHEDKAWVTVLASVSPPPMVKLTDEQITSVASQVDQATAGSEFEAFDAKDRRLYMPMTSSAYVAELQAEALQRGIDMNMALVAVAGRELSPKDIKNTERLRRYWLYGKGAAKIRWFTPGSWRRCYRNVVKYMGPKLAPGYCTNLSQRLGGPGVATHVGRGKKG